MEATTTLRRILQGIQCATDDGNETVVEDEETPPLFSFSQDMSVGQKKRRCAKFLKQGLQTFCMSVGQILRNDMQSSGSGSSTGLKSKAFAKSLSSLAASKCNGDVKSSDSLRNSGSETSAHSLSASASSTSVKSKSASASSTNLNSPSVSGAKSSSSKSESDQKCSGKKAEEKESKVTEGGRKEENLEKNEDQKAAEKKDRQDRKKEEKAEKSTVREETVPQPTKAVSKRKEPLLQDADGCDEGEEGMEVDLVEDSLDRFEEEAVKEKGEKRAKQDSKKSTCSSKERASTEITTQESNSDSKLKQKKLEKKSSRQPDVQLEKTEDCQPVTAANSCDDLSQQEENLFAKLELIQELAEEFCKESAAEKEVQEEVEGGEQDDVGSDDESLPEVSFGVAFIDSDDSASEDKTTDRTSAVKKSGSEKVNDFSDISDADSDVDGKLKSSKQVSGKEIAEKKKKSAGGGEEEEGGSSPRNRGKSASQKEATAKKEEGTVSSSSEEGNSEGGDVCSSDLILSSGEDEERRTKRKRRLKKKSEFSLCLSNQSLSLCPSSPITHSHEHNGTATHKEGFNCMVDLQPITTDLLEAFLSGVKDKIGCCDGRNLSH